MRDSGGGEELEEDIELEGLTSDGEAIEISKDWEGEESTVWVVKCVVGSAEWE